MQRDDERIFSPADLCGIPMNNRIIRSGTFEGLADEEGRPTPELLKFYTRLADGGAGCIITGAIGVSKTGKSPFAGMGMLDQDSNIPLYRDLVTEVHAHGNTPIIAQLSHYGRFSQGSQLLHIDRFTNKEIRQIITEFARAGWRAYQCGFDGVQLQCAHGYLLSEFLSQYANYRDDKWGGTAASRFRIVDEIIGGIHELVPGYPILIKMNCDEERHGGMDPQSAAEYALMMEEAGVCAVEISRGLREDFNSTIRGAVRYDRIMQEDPTLRRIPERFRRYAAPLIHSMYRPYKAKRLYNLDAALTIRSAVPIPMILNGGVHDLDEIRKALLQKRIDFVSMSRPLIENPNLVRMYRDDLCSVSDCTECNCCYSGIMTHSLHCEKNSKDD
ncbi:MAG: NADH:flavin oxidoreductase [Erysipelotrichia bacterium]|nr:NADH:flavin oxidoreductase [Erysipelotrichia bacterium]